MGTKVCVCWVLLINFLVAPISAQEVKGFHLIGGKMIGHPETSTVTTTTTLGWYHVSGGLTHVSPGTFWIWGLNDDGEIWKCDHPCDHQEDWVQIDGSLTQLDVGVHEVWGVNKKDSIFKRPSDGSGSWTHVEGSLKHVSVGPGSVWGIDKDHKVFRCKLPCDGIWKLVSNDAQKVVAPPTPSPAPLTGGVTMKQLDVGTTRVWGLDEDNKIFWHWSDGTDKWNLIAGPAKKLKQISLGLGYVWGVNAKDEIYRCRLPCDSDVYPWEEMYGALKEVDGGFSEVVFGVDAADLVYSRNSQHNPQQKWGLPRPNRLLLNRPVTTTAITLATFAGFAAFVGGAWCRRSRHASTLSHSIPNASDAE